MGNIGFWQLLILLAVVLVIFGTKRFKNIGSDLGDAIKGFKKAMRDDDKDEDKASLQEQKPDAQFTDTPNEEQNKEKQKADKDPH
ncbi:twin-arginine translocase TatA/TatE family subunit [Gallaecimonas sp. GXIMD1310]|uniref:twin-arginine translocase TatA/TatE family subunit n=1 Tax=Gallaecimonas sp. GXIMD1310 TaxID=3131926 RepID=UPI0032490FFF